MHAADFFSEVGLMRRRFEIRSLTLNFRPFYLTMTMPVTSARENISSKSEVYKRFHWTYDPERDGGTERQTEWRASLLVRPLRPHNNH